jgi:hypothetical protein
MPVLYGTVEFQEVAARNKSKQNEFLSERYLQGLEKVFGVKNSGGKVKIEIGWQELKLKQLTKKKTKNGQDMMVVKFWKPPVLFDHRVTPASYDTIDCYHILTKESRFNFEDWWYKPFTTCLSEKQFDVLEKGSVHLCIVEHIEELFISDGAIQTYRQGHRIGEDIILVKPRIVKVYPMDFDRDSLDINYLKLYKSLKR